MKTQLVRVTRTIRQTYYVRVGNAATKTHAREVALAVTDEWGDRNNPELSTSPWVAASRDETDAPEYGRVTVHENVDAKVVL